MAMGRRYGRVGLVGGVVMSLMFLSIAVRVVCLPTIMPLTPSCSRPHHTHTTPTTPTPPLDTRRPPRFEMMW